jgi:hypothetical protein
MAELVEQFQLVGSREWHCDTFRASRAI